MTTKKRKIFLSEEELRYYKLSIIIVLNHLTTVPEDSAGFIISARRNVLTWEMHDRPKMLQLLKTIHRDGLIERIDKGMNFIYWQINDKGKAYLETHKSDYLPWLTPKTR